jgi:hypothetical protein
MVWAPQDWTMDSLGSTTWQLLTGGHKAGSADLWGRHPPWAPVVLCFLVVVVRWVLRSVPSVHWFWGSLLARGPFNYCDVHVSPSDSSGLLPLDWWHGLHAWDPRWQSFLGWGDVAWPTKGELSLLLCLFHLQSWKLQGQVELHYSELNACKKCLLLLYLWVYWRLK